MHEFSLEHISEKIHFGKTREYFNEVLSSYNNKNYRSAVVMLWSVTIVDLVDKLQVLIDVYEDKAASAILKKVIDSQDKSPTSPAWEGILIDDIFSMTSLLDSGEYENLKYLHKQRHLSAHPVINLDRTLHSPNRETVRSLLRNTLEGVLIKPPIYTQKILAQILEDISASRDVLHSAKLLKRYVESRYLNRIKIEVQLKLIKSIWKLVFFTENASCDENRVINYRLLIILSEKNKGELHNLIRSDIDHFSNIASSGRPLSMIVRYLSINSSVYELLNESAKIKIVHCTETDPLIGKICGWFVKSGLDAHYDDISNWILDSDFNQLGTTQVEFLFEASDTVEWEAKCCNLMAEFYSKSVNYSQADLRFESSLAPFLRKFDDKAIIALLSGLNSNSQCYGRGRATSDYSLISNRIDELNEHHKLIDINDYPRFAERVLEPWEF